MKPVLAFLLCVFLYARMWGQEANRSSTELFVATDVLLGMHWQGNVRTGKTFRYYEIGLAKGRYIAHRHGVTGRAVYIAEEIHFGSNTIYGTKVGAWMHWLLDAGLALVYYTDLHRANFRVRPELGWGMGKVRAVMGYNIPTVGNKKFTELSNNNLQISIQAGLGIRKKKSEIR